jgi:branched-chain amino acid transport system permease protein
MPYVASLLIEVLNWRSAYLILGGLVAVVGVGIIDLFSFHLSHLWETGWPIVLGLLLLVVVMFRPTGLIGFLVSEREREGFFGRRETGSGDNAAASAAKALTP